MKKMTSLMLAVTLLGCTIAQAKTTPNNPPAKRCVHHGAKVICY